MFTKENVISAKLINEEHTTIEVVHTIEGDDKAHSYILEYDKDSQDFKALEKAGWDLERVTEETMAYKREASRIHDKSVEAAAMEWLKANPTEVFVDTPIPVTDIIGTIISKNEDEDSLFKAKLAVMELDSVKGSKATKVKQDIRKAKSLIELISHMNKL
jgi:hypothetical protein